MWRGFAALVHLGALAEAGGCTAGTTGVQLVRERGYDLTGQTHVITGGDSGLGLGIATALMEANARVVFLAHDWNKTHAEAHTIERLTGNGNFRVISVDLLSLNSTSDAADALMDEQTIDAFVGDAGTIMAPSVVTGDGFESEFQLEYLSHFYLVQRLLPKLRESHGRIVFTGSDATSPYDTVAGLCSQLNEAPGCEAIDRIDARVKRAVPPQIFAHFNGNEFLGLYLREMLARQVALSETNVTAFSFHPGWAATPGTSGAFDIAADEFFGIFLLGTAGLVLGCLIGCILCCWGSRRYIEAASGAAKAKAIGNRCVAFCLALLLGIFLGGLAGYWFAGDWVAALYCGMAPYYQCLCRGPDGAAAATCPLSAFEGSMGGAYLAAANASEIAGVNGAMTVLCGAHPADVAFDPYVGMVDKLGEQAARDYLQTLYDQSQRWIDEAGHGSSQSNLAETASDGAGVASCAQILALIGVGLVTALPCVAALASGAMRGRADRGASGALLAAA